MSRLKVENLTVVVPATGVELLHGVSFDVGPGEIVGLVGESGSGKSVTSLAIMGILPQELSQTSGLLTVDGVDSTASANRSVEYRFAMIFQNPRDSLNPLMKAGAQIARMIRIHQGLDKKQAAEAAIALLGQVRITDPGLVAASYPHQLSGGMCQRVMIAMALACKPTLLIADEPTTALDVTVQAQILDLIVTLAEETGCAVLLITHDLGVVAETCDRVNVLYQGDLVESATVDELFANPQHEYTRYLLAAGTLDEEETDHGVA